MPVSRTSCPGVIEKLPEDRHFGTPPGCIPPDRKPLEHDFMLKNPGFLGHAGAEEPVPMPHAKR